MSRVACCGFVVCTCFQPAPPQCVKLGRRVNGKKIDIGRHLFRVPLRFRARSNSQFERVGRHRAQPEITVHFGNVVRPRHGSPIGFDYMVLLTECFGVFRLDASRKTSQKKSISNVNQFTQLDCVTQFSLPNQNMPLHDHKKGQGNIATCCPQQKSVAQSMCDHIGK